MNIKFLFDPIDRLIDQAKDYIRDQDTRKKAIKLIEEKVESIRPELERRREELLVLLDQIEPSAADIRDKLNSSIQQLDHYLKYIELIAEKEMANDILASECQVEEADFREQKEKYVVTEVLRLEDALESTDNFFEVADYANQIWADFELFEEFHREEVVVQMLVNRMNETNTKNTETRIGKDLRKTLEHIRVNLIKTTSWSEEQIEEYQLERDRKIRKLKSLNAPKENNFTIYLIGGTEDFLKNIKQEYDVPPNLKMCWVDVGEKQSLENAFRNATRNDLVIFMTHFPEYEIFTQPIEELKQNNIPFITCFGFEKAKFIKLIEDELIRIAFNNQFNA